MKCKEGPDLSLLVLTLYTMKIVTAKNHSHFFVNRGGSRQKLLGKCFYVRMGNIEYYEFSKVFSHVFLGSAYLGIYSITGNS